MKKFFLLSALGLVVFGGLFLSCQKNEIVSPEEGLRLKSAITCVNTFVAENAVSVYENAGKNIRITTWNDATKTFIRVKRTSGDMTVRIASPGRLLTQENGPTILEAGTEIVYEITNDANWNCGDAVTFSFYLSGLGGGADNNKLQTGIISYNLRGLCTTTNLVSDLTNPVCVDDVVTLTASVTASESVTTGILKIQEYIGSAWTDVAMTTATTFAYTPGAEGTRTFKAVYSGTGTGKFCSSESSSLGITAEACGCEDQLTVDFNCETRIAIFTFIAAETGPIVIQGGLTAKTSIVSATSEGLTLNPNHPSAGGTANVTSWEGNVEACQEVTVTIQFTGGDGIGDWSAKRGGIVLGQTSSISCN